jgi:IMP dehydrogenase/GMP reductase
MKIYTKEELSSYQLSLTYDDISLVPTQISEIRSRVEASTKTKFLESDFGLPVISSPMDSVTGIDMALELQRLGCLGIVNRFDSSLNELLKRAESADKIKAVSVALNSPDEIVMPLAENGYIICIDTANAGNKAVLDKCDQIKKKFNTKVIVGNIAQGSMLRDLVNAGADAVRIGIGGGSVCTTSIQTGIGIGQVSSLLDVYFTREKENLKIELIADGGIKSPGDIAKAIALGADVVMLGRMLAGTKETPGEVIKYSDQLWKKYRGSASFGVKMKNEFIEGEETMVPYRGAVKNVIDGISDGLRSSMSYMNCYDLASLRTTNTFAVLSNSSYLERLPKK